MELAATPATATMLSYSADRTEPLLALPGPAEWWPILLVVVLLFGARKLPELARAMGTSITQFRKGLDSATDEDDEPKAVEAKDGESVS